MVTWAMLGLHKKPVALLNTDGFYNELISFIQIMVDNGFLKKENKDILIVSDNIADLLKKMKEYQAPVGKWVNKEETLI